MKLRYILLLLLLPALFIACDDDDCENVPGDKMSVSRTMKVDAQAADYTIVMTADNITVTSTDTSWCKPVMEKKYVVTIKIAENDTSIQRIATLNLQAGLLTETISVVQSGKEDKEEVIPDYPGYTLAWHDEFNKDGVPDPEEWRAEVGFQRNQEIQWYQADNVICKNGMLVITGRKERVKNPNYEAGSSDWKKNRQYAEYTSSCIVSKYRFNKGRMEVKAKIPTAVGAWPAIWTTGGSNDSYCWEWPLGGEIDLLEYYLVGGKQSIHANVCWGSDTRWSGKWKSYNRPFSTFTAKDPDWADKFHIWRMDWDSEYLRLYLDDELLNEVPLSTTTNGGGGLGGNDAWWRGAWRNPFTDAGNDGDGFGQQIFLNLALGSNGGTPDTSKFPLEYLVDYVRVYQKTAE